MKKFFYLLPAIALVFAACSDDDDDKGGLGNNNTVIAKASEMKNLPAQNEITEVRLVNGYNGAALATAEWDNGFELKFPEAVTTGLLSAESFFDYDEEDYTGSITISNKNAKIAHAYVYAFKGNEQLSRLEYGTESKSQYTDVSYIYTDTAISAKGTVVYEDEEDGKETIKVDLNLKQGWNRVANTGRWISEDETYHESTTSIPGGLAWKYGYYDWD